MQRRYFAALAGGLALVLTFMMATTASAHAPIVSITWDSQTNPTSLTASTDQREIEAAPNSFFVRVYTTFGERVDNGDATLSPDRFSIRVTLQADLPEGTYEVEWLTTSTDGAVLSGRETLTLPGSFGTTAPVEEEHEEAEEPEAEEAAPEEEATAPVAPPSTGDGGLATGRDHSFGLAGAFAAIALATAGGAALAYRRLS